MREICEKGNLYQIDLCVKLLEPPFNIWLYAEILFQRNVPMLVINESNGFGKRGFDRFLRSFFFEQT
jgi:hypothetical protein